MELNYFGITEVGRREKNEDSFLIFENKFGNIIAVVADGMGGHKGGSIASGSVVKMVKKKFKDIDFNQFNSLEVKKELFNIIRMFQKDLKKIGDIFPQYIDMGSTMNLNIFSKDKFYTINIGDSRTQLITNKKITQISQDHNLSSLAKTNPRYAHYSEYSNVLTSSLGPTKDTIADFYETDLTDKGFVVMTSDGVHNHASDDFIISSLNKKGELSDKMQKIIKKAYDNGSSDNMTLLVIEFNKA